jgi:hypothetical protein
MKNFLCFALAVIAFSPFQLHAQTNDTANAAAPAPAAPPSPIDVLVPEEKAKLSAAHDKALIENTPLRDEEYALKAKADSFHENPPTPEAKQQFIASFKAYRAKLEVAMLKADPTIQPILDKLHAAAARLNAAHP